MPINAVSQYIGLAWRTVKHMDQRALAQRLPALGPGAFTGLGCLGVEEVARSKGYDHFTIVYDVYFGDLFYGIEGRSRNSF